MLEFIVGKDQSNRSDQLRERMVVAQAAEIMVERISSDTYQSGLLPELAEATPLFGGLLLYIVDLTDGVVELQTDVWQNIMLLYESSHTFVVVVSTLSAAERKQLPAAVPVVATAETPKPTRFNTFQLADALVSKDKRRLWVLVQQARQAGIAAEEIIGVLWWQLKAIRLTQLTTSPAAAGLKPFVYQKAKRASAVYTEPVLHTMMQSLLAVYHEGHEGRDIDLALEKWVLEL